MTFLDILFVELGKFLSGISDFFLLPYTYMIILQIDRNFKSVIFFILPNCFFHHMDFTFKSFSKEASLGFSLTSGSFTHFWYFQVPELFKVSFFFYNSPYWWPIDSCLSGESMFSSLETVLGQPEPSLLSIKPVSLNFFNRPLTEE